MRNWNRKKIKLKEANEIDIKLEKLQKKCS